MHSLKPVAIADWSLAQRPVLPRRPQRLANEGVVIRNGLRAMIRTCGWPSAGT
jgi:hypothetical protein